MSEEHRKCGRCFHSFDYEVSAPYAPICSLECQHALCKTCIFNLYQIRPNKKTKSISCDLCEKAKAFTMEIQPNVSFCSILKELHDVKEELKEYKEERNAKRRCIDVDETEGGGDTSTIPALNNNDDMEDRKIAARTTTASATECGDPLDHQETVTGESLEAAEASHAATDETSGTSVTAVNESDTVVPSAAVPNSDGTAIEAAASMPAEDTTDPVARSIQLDQGREDYQSAIAQSLGLDRAAWTSPQQQDASPEGGVSLAVRLAISRSTGQGDEGTPDGSGSAQDPLVILEHDDAEKDLQLDYQRAIAESLIG